MADNIDITSVWINIHRLGMKHYDESILLALGVGVGLPNKVDIKIMDAFCVRGFQEFVSRLIWIYQLLVNYGYVIDGSMSNVKVSICCAKIVGYIAK